jgi:hypothetical protein
MADFVQSSQTRNAVRELATPIASVSVFNLIVQSVITDNPFACVSYMTAGETHDPVEKTKESYTAKMVYEDVEAVTVGTGSHRFNTIAGAAALLAHPLFPVIISWVLYHDYSIRCTDPRSFCSRVSTGLRFYTLSSFDSPQKKAWSL